VNIILNIVFFYFAFYSLYYLIFSLAGNFNKKRKAPAIQPTPGNFAVFIPCYKEDAVVLSTVHKSLSHNYPSDKFRIVVLADSLQQKTLDELGNLPVTVVLINNPQRSKGKAINTALNELKEDFDYIMILDADNNMEDNCMYKMNEVLQSGILAVQGHRTAKNKNNSVAFLDSISEEINNHIFRQGPRVIGLSSALIGSGMAFKYSYFKEIMHGVEDIWEDKALEFRILRDRHIIEYLPDAYVYDEKVSDIKVFQKQRSKWLGGQMAYLKMNTLSDLKAIFSGNIDLLSKVIQTFALPRSIMLVMVFGFFALGLIYKGSATSDYWFLLVIAFVFSLLIAVPKEMFNKKLLKALFVLPVLIAQMFRSLFKSLVSKDVNFNTPHVHK
jgi:cellulose synthase/poly-beta-1,6-N-acetylglucosamine synthase-like glycosyltransferase